MTTKNTDSYQNSVWKLFLDENDRFPIGILDDFVINPKNLKIDWFLVRNWFLNDSKIIKASMVNRWWDVLFISSKNIKSLSFYENIKNILIEWNSVIWKKVVSETGESMWRVYDLIFSNSSFVWFSIIVKKSFFGLFFYWKERIVSKKNILDINLEKIVVRNESLIKA